MNRSPSYARGFTQGSHNLEQYVDFKESGLDRADYRLGYKAGREYRKHREFLKLLTGGDAHD